MTRPSLATELAGIPLASPLLLAAGTAGVLDEMAGAADLSRVGAIVTKSITREPRVGNPAWRVHPLPVGMLNAIGLANPGIEAFVELANQPGPPSGGNRIAALPCAVIGSAAGYSIEDYAGVCGGFARVPGLAAVELNVSCPNVHGGTDFGLDTGALAEVVAAAREAVERSERRLPLIVKLSPVVQGSPSIVDLARAAVEAGASALTVANTVPAMAIDVEHRKPVLANTTGGLSGPAVHPITLRLLHTLYTGFARDAGVPLVGLGGVVGWRDAAAYFLAGASAVGLGTALLASPGSAGRIHRGLERWAARQRVERLADLIGKLELHRDG